MSCCVWKRNNTDALKDPSTGKIYCGTCWQNWVDKRTARSCTKTSRSKPHHVHISESRACLSKQSLGDTPAPTRTRNDTLRRDKKTEKPETLIANGKLSENVATKPRTQFSDLASEGRELQQTQRFPFDASAEDHCETPLDAYEDIAPFLQYLAKQIGKKRGSLKIWDPYFCNGGVSKNLAQLGFFNVYNKCENFYQVLRTGNLPDHDCILTNPPYSTEPTDHIQELVKFLCSQSKPWFVLQPNYVYMKPFWEQVTSSMRHGPLPFFLCPNSPRKYEYMVPMGFRKEATGRELRTSPFVSMWYCWLGEEHTARLYKWVCTKGCDNALALSLSCNEFFIPDSFKDSSDKTRRKKRKKSKNKTSGSDNGISMASDTEIGVKRRRKAASG